MVRYLSLHYVTIRFILHAWPGSECVSSNKIYVYIYILYICILCICIYAHGYMYNCARLVGVKCVVGEVELSF